MTGGRGGDPATGPGGGERRDPVTDRTVTGATTVSIIPDGVLAYGMQLPVQAQSVLTSAPWERAGAGPDDILAVAQAADRAGFCYVAGCDHVAIPAERTGTMSATWYHPVALLAWLAPQTRRVRLATSTWIAAYRHPLETAKVFATLDLLSGGRLILGVGAGHLEGEFAALGVPFTERGRRTDAAIDTVIEAWTTGVVGGMHVEPRPHQQPRPPIWIGGSSPAALRRVATRGDGWIPQGTPRAEMPAAIEMIRAHRDRTRPGARLELGVITELVHVGRAAWDLPRGTVTGPAEAVAASLNAYGAMGVAHLQVRFATRSAAELCEQVERFGTEVGPLLHREVGRW